MDEESKQSDRFDFDGFWKDLIERFWRELLKSLLPTLYAVADLTKEPVFLDKELRDVLHIPDDQDSLRFVDVLLKIPLKDGGEKYVLLHIEVQGPGGENLTFRMFDYFCRLFGHYHRVPVALAILTAARMPSLREAIGFAALGRSAVSEGSVGRFPETLPRSNETAGVFEASEHGTSVCYNFNCLELDKLDDEKLLASDNPFDLALYAARRAKRSRNDENMKFRYLRELRRLLGQKGWTDRDCRDLLLFIEWIINLKDPELREDYTSFKDETEETKVRFKALSTDHILEQGREQGRLDGITIGEQRGRQEKRKIIMERLIAGGISPQQAAAFTGVNV